MKVVPYKVGIVTTHPIQYQVPWFRRLAGMPELDLTVFYCQIPTPEQQGVGFGIPFKWNLPLLEGYRYEILTNVARRPSVTSFLGCDTPDVYRRLHHSQFDAVIVNGWIVKSCLQTLLACKRQGIPCIVRGEANAIRPRPRWKRMLHRLLLRQYSAYLFIGQRNAEFYRGHRVPEEKLFPARYFVDNDYFAEQVALVRSREMPRTRWAIPEKSTVYLYCAKFTPMKHPLELLAAFRLALAKQPSLHLLMVGDGTLRSACEAYAKERQLPVTFAGFLNQNEICAAYAAADCLVLPSDHGETWGLVVNEAMACSVPAIVSDQVGSGPDLIEQGRTGYVFPFGNWAALADLLATLGANRDGLRQQGAVARTVVAGYSAKAAAAATLSAVEFVVDHKSRKSR